ncbi:DUF1439 domain-containing protein [Puniceicoccus vermicola]|uniref:DUF1439 domain-containing protein n=1 Tax=Puniceicoccus vermicola TaxID=388746 RepID=A0A7X1B2B9_9BACT|nr:DUF1439 domain-containing protein [Puniceicoccus vermicola]MBC2604257.1 DUF1439 domain-containing protein [Puniceicoccus vermicola]
MGKKLTIALVILIVLGIASFIFLKTKGITVSITQPMIDKALETAFPKSDTYLTVVEVTYSNPVVKLLESSNRIEIGMDAKVGLGGGLLGKSYSGSVQLSSGLRYDSETLQFFLNEPTVDKIDIPGVPSNLSDQVVQAVTKASQQFLQDIPVYKLNTEDFKIALAAAVLKGFEIRDQEIQVTLGL